MARFGLFARGVVYIVIGVIGFMLALGVAQHTPDRAGAIEAIATKPLGYPLLWLLVIGFAALALWRLSQAVGSRVPETGRMRLYVLVVGIAYAVVCIGTLMFVVNGRTPESSNEAPRDLSERLLSYSGGWVVLALLGLAAFAIGIRLSLGGLRNEFTDHLRMGWMRESTREMVVWLGRAGYMARGVIVAAIGLGAMDAAVTYDSAHAKGLDGVMLEFARTPWGPWLLVLVSIGLVAFGLLSFLESKWRRTYGGVPV